VKRPSRGYHSRVATRDADRAPDSPPPAGEERRSAAAADARRRDAARVAAMTATERALLALDLGDRYAEWAKRGAR
jgi:hypothetical protein